VPRSVLFLYRKGQAWYTASAAFVALFVLAQITGPIDLFGMEEEVDVMIESKAKELALLGYREAVLNGSQHRSSFKDALTLAVSPSPSVAALPSQQVAAVDGVEVAPATDEDASAAGRAQGDKQSRAAPPVRFVRRMSLGEELGGVLAGRPGAPRGRRGRRRGKDGSTGPGPDVGPPEAAASLTAMPAQKLAAGVDQVPDAAEDADWELEGPHEEEQGGAAPPARRAGPRPQGEEAGGAVAGSPGPPRAGRGRKRIKRTSGE
jgi:hypothetical protein